jgi:hypothetical protein
MSHTIEPVVISTISDLAKYEMSLSLYCLLCYRWGEIEPSEWLADGKHYIDYVKQGFKCGECGGKAEKQVRTTPVLFNVESAYQGMFKRETEEEINEN